MGAVARRLGQRDLERGAARCVAAAEAARLMLHREREAAHERMLRREPQHQPGEQQARAVEHLLGGVGAGEKLEAAFEHRRQHEGHARVGLHAERTIELVQQMFAEAPRQAGARQAAQVAERTQPHALQRLPVFAAGAEQPHRRGLERLARRGEIRAMELPVHARQQRRPLRGGRTHGVDAVVQRAQCGMQALQQAHAPAEITQARLDLEQHRVRRRIGITRRLDHHARRESERGMRHRLERLGVAHPVGPAEHELRRERERGRPLQPRLDTQRLRRGVDADDALGVHQRKRCFGRRVRVGAERCRKRFERQRRQMQGDPEHGKQSTRGNRISPGKTRSEVHEGRGLQDRLLAHACLRALACNAGKHRRQWEPQPGGERRPAAFEDAHAQHVGACRVQRQPQRRGRGTLCGREFTQHESDPVVVVRRQLKTPQALGSQARGKPGEHRPDMPALQRLLQRPEAVAARNHAGPGVDDQELFDIEAEIAQSPGRQGRRRVE